MLEPCLNQAAGLQGLAARQTPKLIAVASHGEQKGELPLLWSLCAAWVDMGLTVTVLDGHAKESKENPGLQQMLGNAPSGLLSHHDNADWAVLPASQGLTQLPKLGRNLTTLGTLLRDCGVVLLYADAGTLTGLLRGSGLAPLVVVAPLKTSSITAYQAVKQLLLDAHLHPTVANITMTPSASSAMPPSNQNLQDCAKTFLGLAIKPISVSAMAKASDSRNEINRLALQLLESAISLEPQLMERIH